MRKTWVPASCILLLALVGVYLGSRNSGQPEFRNVIESDCYLSLTILIEATEASEEQAEEFRAIFQEEFDGWVDWYSSGLSSRERIRELEKLLEKAREKQDVDSIVSLKAELGQERFGITGQSPWVLTFLRVWDLLSDDQRNIYCREKEEVGPGMAFPFLFVDILEPMDDLKAFLATLGLDEYQQDGIDRFLSDCDRMRIEKSMEVSRAARKQYRQTRPLFDSLRSALDEGNTEVARKSHQELCELIDVESVYSLFPTTLFLVEIMLTETQQDAYLPFKEKLLEEYGETPPLDVFDVDLSVAEEMCLERMDAGDGGNRSK